MYPCSDIKRVDGLLIVLAIWLSACQKREYVEPQASTSSPSYANSTTLPSEPGTNFVLIAHAHTQGGKHVDLYADQATLREGYHKFRVKVTLPNGQPYAGTDVRILPMMYMGTHNHSCPVEQIQGGPDANGFYEGAAFFMMPSMANQPWKMHVAVGLDTADITIQVNPHPDGWVRRGRQFGNPQNPPYIYGLTLNQRTVGTQTALFHVYYRDRSLPATNPSAFPPADNRVSQLEIVTYNPSTQQTVPGPQDATPVSGKPGHYQGQANFPASGTWHIIAKFKDPSNNLIGQDTFVVNITTVTSLNTPRR
ncbi:MAG: hypothetical protein N2253_01395 [Bacteroidia bacterium]|nr:hypothetical protein [Bacteroidia bacterium]